MDGDSNNFNRFLATIEARATVVFTVEVFLELAAAGSFGRYFSSSWNLFDFVLIAAGFTKFLPFGNSTSTFKVCSFWSLCCLMFVSLCGWSQSAVVSKWFLVLCTLGNQTHMSEMTATIGCKMHHVCIRIVPELCVV